MVNATAGPLLAGFVARRRGVLTPDVLRVSQGELTQMVAEEIAEIARDRAAAICQAAFGDDLPEVPDAREGNSLELAIARLVANERFRRIQQQTNQARQAIGEHLRNDPS